MCKTKIDLTGVGKKPPRRRPYYIHDPEAIRKLAEILGKYDYKSREAVFLQLQLFLKPPEARVRKCLKLASDPNLNWRVVRAAVNNMISLISIPFTCDHDRNEVKETFSLLRFYTFLIEPQKIKQYLENEGRESRQIVKIATDFADGKMIKWEICPIEKIDDWISEAEKPIKK